jgi:hypothetical protein
LIDRLVPIDLAETPAGSLTLRLISCYHRGGDRDNSRDVPSSGESQQTLLPSRPASLAPDELVRMSISEIGFMRLGGVARPWEGVTGGTADH